MVRREPGDIHIVGEDWHTDTTMVAEPPMGAILYGIDVPAYGGDTMFANQYQAYDALSAPMKRLLEGLRAVHSDIGIAGPNASRNKLRSTKNRDDDGWRETRSLHPIVRTHPETGRKCLFVNASYTIGIEGMTPAEGRRCSTSCWSTAIGPNSPSASAGRRARSPSGTTAAPSTSRWATPAPSAA